MSITAGSIAFFISDVFSWQDAQIIVPTGWTIYIGKNLNSLNRGIDGFMEEYN